jgi:hypothetical protein
LAEAEALKIDSFGIIDRLFLNRVALKGKKNELLYKFIDRRIFRLSEGHGEAREKETRKVSKTRSFSP